MFYRGDAMEELLGDNRIFMVGTIEIIFTGISLFMYFDNMSLKKQLYYNIVLREKNR